MECPKDYNTFECEKFAKFEKFSHVSLFLIFVATLNVVMLLVTVYRAEALQDQFSKNLERLTRLDGHLTNIENKIEKACALK